MSQEIDVETLAEWRRNERVFVLLDVRDPEEVAIAAFPEAVKIPMQDIPNCVDELDRSATIAVLCHYGGRSARVAQFLRDRGFTDVYNIDGGINAYAQRIDLSIPRY